MWHFPCQGISLRIAEGNRFPHKAAGSASQVQDLDRPTRRLDERLRLFTLGAPLLPKQKRLQHLWRPHQAHEVRGASCVPNNIKKTATSCRPPQVYRIQGIPSLLNKNDWGSLGGVSKLMNVHGRRPS